MTTSDISLTTAPKPFVFVLMPFAPEFEDIYKLGIKPACQNVGAYAERVNEQIFAESILDRIYNQISKADLIVADMTGKNPNVFYEAGYAHALGKRVILLTQKSEDIPFDLKHYPHIVYGGRIVELISELEKRVRWAIQQPKGEPVLSQVSFFLKGEPISKEKPVVHDIGIFPAESFDIKLDVHNSIAKQLKKANFQLGFIFDDRFAEIQVYLSSSRLITLKRFEQKEGKSLFLYNKMFEILPGSWEAIMLRLWIRGKTNLQENELIHGAIRVFSDNGTEDFPFCINVTGKKIDVKNIRKIMLKKSEAT
jgi:hypothetical protein